MKISSIIITDLTFDQIGLFSRLLNAGIVIEFHNMFWDFLGRYHGELQIKNRKDFEDIMIQLNLSNKHLNKANDGYNYNERVRCLNKSVSKITGFIEATDYINNKGDKKGLIAFLKCGGVVRINDKDYCYLDMNDFKNELNNKIN